MASKLSLFLAELKRRKVYRVAAAYVVVGLGILGAAELILDPLGLGALRTAVVVLVLLGFPIALVLAWAYEVRPEEPREIETESIGSAEALIARDRRSIVVLPFDNMSPDPGDAYFCDGLTEEIITTLSHLGSLRVISRNSSMVLKGTQKSTGAIAEELRVEYVLEGSVRKAGDELRITAQLIDARTDAHLWAEKYDGVLDDVFGIQEDVSRAIVEALSLKISPEESLQISEAPITDVRAYESYLRARYEMYRFSEQGLARALQEASNGLEVLGEDPLLLSVIGSCYVHYINQGLSSDVEYLDRAEAVAKRIFRIDPRSSHGLRLLGLVQYKRGLIWEAIRSLEGAREKDLSNSENAAYLNYWYGDVGMVAEMPPLVKELIEDNPLDWTTWWASGWYELIRGQFDLAAASFDRLLRMDPENPMGRLSLGHAAALSGVEADACRILEPLTDRPTNSIFGWVASLYRGVMEPCVGSLPPPPAEEIRRRLWSDEYLSWIVAGGYARGGHGDEAVEWLGNAADRGFVNFPFLNDHDRFLDPIRDEPALQQLLEEIRRRWESHQQ